MKTLTIPNCPICGISMLMLTGIPFIDERGRALIAGPAKEYKYGCATCGTFTTIPNERLQAAEPPVTDATFTVGDRVRDTYTEEVGTVKSIARNEQWQEGDLFSPHWFTVDFDKSGTTFIGGNYIKADEAVTDERATDSGHDGYVRVVDSHDGLAQWERRFEQQPASTLRKGDVVKINGVTLHIKHIARGQGYSGPMTTLGFVENVAAAHYGDTALVAVAASDGAE